jgi:hypothetical protein
MTGASAAVRAISASKEGEATVQSLQELHAQSPALSQQSSQGR